MEGGKTNNNFYIPLFYRFLYPGCRLKIQGQKTLFLYKTNKINKKKRKGNHFIKVDSISNHLDLKMTHVETESSHFPFIYIMGSCGFWS